MYYIKAQCIVCCVRHATMYYVKSQLLPATLCNTYVIHKWYYLPPYVYTHTPYVLLPATLRTTYYYLPPYVCTAYGTWIVFQSQSQFSISSASFQRNVAKETYRTEASIQIWERRIDTPHAIGVLFGKPTNSLGSRPIGRLPKEYRQLQAPHVCKVFFVICEMHIMSSRICDMGWLRWVGSIKL